jgi:hypothetical protein
MSKFCSVECVLIDIYTYTFLCLVLNSLLFCVLVGKISYFLNQLSLVCKWRLAIFIHVFAVSGCFYCCYFLFCLWLHLNDTGFCQYFFYSCVFSDVFYWNIICVYFMDYIIYMAYSRDWDELLRMCMCVLLCGFLMYWISEYVDFCELISKINSFCCLLIFSHLYFVIIIYWMVLYVLYIINPSALHIIHT